MKTYVPWIITGFLVIVIAVGSGYVMLLSSNLNDSEGEITGYLTEIANIKAETAGAQDDAEAAVSAYQTTLSAIQENATKSAVDSSVKSTEIAALQASVDELSAAKDGLDTAISLLNKDIEKLETENQDLSDLFCEEYPISVDYSSNKTVSDRLSQFVEGWKNAEEPVSAHYWNTIWSGDKFSIHTVEVLSEKNNVNYVWKFTAYFEGEASGAHRNGIFWNDRQCWLALDE